MLGRALAVPIAVLITTNLVAAEATMVRTDWAGFRDQVAQRKLKERGVWISLASAATLRRS